MEPAASGKKPLYPAKKKWIILAAAAAALVLFVLWYTRPRSWAEVAGQRAFTSLNAQYQEITAEAGGTAFHVWELEIQEPVEEAMEELMSALRDGWLLEENREEYPGLLEQWEKLCQEGK